MTSLLTWTLRRCKSQRRYFDVKLGNQRFAQSRHWPPADQEAPGVHYVSERPVFFLAAILENYFGNWQESRLVLALNSAPCQIFLFGKTPTFYCLIQDHAM